MKITISATAVLLLLSIAIYSPLSTLAQERTNPFVSKKAATYYVSPQGDNTNPGSQALPWQTIQFAVDEATPGDTILVEDGVYEGPVIMTRSGEPGAYITLRSINKWGAKVEVIDGEGDQDGIKAAANYLTIDGFELFDANPGPGRHGNGITVYNNHHVNILNNNIHDFGGSGIQAAHFDHVLIENNVVYNNAKYNPLQTSGISLYQAIAVDDAPGYHIIVRNNRSFGNINLVPTNAGQTFDGNGILVDDFRNNTGDETNIIYPHRTLIENNLCYDNGGKGIQVYRSDNVDIFNNTTYHNNHDLQSESTWRGELSLISSTSTVWRNNIGIANPGEGVLERNSALFISKGGDTVWENNLTYNGTPGDLAIHIDNSTVTEAYLLSNNMLGIDPLLTDAAGLDFSLTSESPAIDVGSDEVVSFVDINYQNRPLGALDVGAFEYAPFIPVEISAFDAVVDITDIQLTWTTSLEINNAGFDVELQSPGGAFEQVAFIESQGTSNTSQTYETTLENLLPGIYLVRLKQISINGLFSYTESLEVVVEEDPNLPVELIAFDAIVSGGDIQLHWTTASELNNAGFFVELQVADHLFESVLFVDGHGTTNAAQEYQTTLKDLIPGDYRVRLKQVDFDGTFDYSPTVEVRIQAEAYHLAQSYPNPFNPQTSIQYTLPLAHHVTLQVYDTLGRKIQTLVDEQQVAGTHAVHFDASHLPNGTYIYRLTAGPFSETKTMILLK